MREMVLNHASLTSPDRRAALGWLKDTAVGMAQLVLNGVVQSSLRTSFPVYQIDCLPDYSLSQAYQDLRKDGARDEHLFLMRLSTRCPLLSEVQLDVKNRFLSCEAKELPPEDGEPLVLCAITDWIAVGFPSDSVWNGDRLTVNFEELLPDESFEEASETIDNLAQSVHACSICERHREALLQYRSPLESWSRREEAFPNLIFGPDVEIPTRGSSPIVKRLIELDRSVAEWGNVGGASPRWRCKVTPESNRVKNDRRLLDERRFRSQNGTRELFEWHARVGNGIRIHLRFDPGSREVEIGYIGPHLPL